MSTYEPAGVPAAPNQSRITARVERVGPAPGGVGAVWEVQLRRAAAEPAGMANLARSHVGRRVTIYVHPGFKQAVGPGDVIDALVTYQGDERGGAFFLKGDSVTKAR
jgi:hypothetical protein